MIVVTQFEKKLHRTFGSFLVDKGFNKGPFDNYVNCHSNFDQSISLRVLRVGSDFGVKYLFGCKYHIIENLWQDLNSSYALGIPAKTLLLSRVTLDPSLEDTRGYPILKGGGILLRSEDLDNEILRLVKLFEDDYERILVSFFKKAANIIFLDKVLNQDSPEALGYIAAVPKEGIVFRRLIVAKLAGNQNYDNIYFESKKRIEEFLKVNNEDKKAHLRYEVLKAINERLKGVEPLLNPILL